MRPGRSFSSAAAPRAAIVAGLLLLQTLAPRPATAGTPSPDPLASPPASNRPASSCARCGYRNDPGAHYCIACGWDLTILVGDAAQRRMEAIGRAVVGVTVEKESQRLEEMMPAKYTKWLRYFGLGGGDRGRHRYFGSAFPDLRPGLYVTSARLLDRAVEVRLRTYDNRQFPAQVVALDLPSGIGLMKADIPGAVPLAVAERDPAPPEGAWVVCYPVDREETLVRYLPQSLHRGQITATGQIGTGLASIENLLRSDHSIPEGCGGGPLIDLRGGLVGMTLLGPEPGLTYAVPHSDLAPILEALARGTAPERPFFGIGLVAADTRRRARFALEETASGPLIGFLVPGSPAESSGAQPGDLLVAVNGEKVAGVPEAGARLLRGAAPSGGAVALTLLRRGQEVKVSIVPGKRPERILLAPADEIQETLEANLVEVTTGPTTQQGLRVADLVRGGRGEQQGYRNGDLIVAVDNKVLRRYETFNTSVRSQNPQIFGDGKGEGAAPIPMYAVRLDVKPGDGGPREGRSYTNLAPFVLAPPVY